MRFFNEAFGKRDTSPKPDLNREAEEFVKELEKRGIGGDAEIISIEGEREDSGEDFEREDKRPNSYTNPGRKAA